ncbi:MAG: hypothetical protein HFH93_04135 [Lachnospiraceae bacterium]|nr:hypothetical protein [Lachnospiraceae bacterium]
MHTIEKAAQTASIALAAAGGKPPRQVPISSLSLPARVPIPLSEGKDVLNDGKTRFVLSFGRTKGF